jgi:hypothetical protein
MNASSRPEEEMLRAGVDVLRPVFEPHGFAFRMGMVGKGSGGYSASGFFEHGEKSLEFHVRYDLGMVTYRIGKAELDHETYLRYAGHWAQRRYPKFGGAVLESFQALALDLIAFGQDFLSGNGAEFTAFAAQHAANPNRFKGFASLGKK